MRWCKASVKGLVRAENEDDLCVCPELGLFAVADGMGGHRAGEVASSLALKFLKESVTGNLTSAASPESVLLNGTRYANRMVYQIAGGKQELRGMGTTLTASLVTEKRITLAHVGDSRIYLIRDKAIYQLTEDHSLVQEMVRKGELTNTEAYQHPQRSVLTRALGIEPDLVVDTAHFDLRINDKILLCTDGLTKHVQDGEILNQVFNQVDLKKAVNSLLEMSFAQGGTDNITIIIIEI